MIATETSANVDIMNDGLDVSGPYSHALEGMTSIKQVIAHYEIDFPGQKWATMRFRGVCVCEGIKQLSGLDGEGLISYLAWRPLDPPRPLLRFWLRLEPLPMAGSAGDNTENPLPSLLHGRRREGGPGRVRMMLDYGEDGRLAEGQRNANGSLLRPRSPRRRTGTKRR